MQEHLDNILTVTNRTSIHVTGVQSVAVFEEEKITLHTELGILEILGSQLNITLLDLEVGELRIEGTIDSMTYPHEKWKRNNKKQVKSSFIAKMLS